MESSHLVQRVLTFLSITLLGVTGAAWWWVSNQSKQPEEQLAKVSIQSPADSSTSSATATTLDSASSMVATTVDSAASLPVSVQSEVASTPASSLRLAAYEQQEQETAPKLPAGLPIPDAGVAVPSATLPSANLLTYQSGSIKYKGILAFVNDVRVVAQAEGVIREFLVDEGSIIERDKVIVEIDNRLAMAEQQVSLKELESAQLKADDESQIRFAEAAEKVAAADYKRTEDLFKREVANIDEYERKQLEWQKAKLSIDVSKREKKINEASVSVSEAKYNASGVQVELRTIRAPFTGIVAKTEKENFEWVKAGDEILRLVSLEKFRVRGRVQIDDSPNILERAPAKVFVQVQPGQVETVDGIVGFVEPETSVAVDGKNEYGVWVEIDNRIVNGQYLFRGKMNATVEIYPKR
ncbi:MAG: HlyD family efflux transporter periplasmic adaptor subunit [Planctomycetes bacterium]|nr:HlyD family efflux transporter periplasmic adaptor subunit [Planctomycetota bacterium]